MRVAITGSSGLVGRALSAELRSRGDEVVPLVRRAPATGEIGWDPVAGTVDEGAFERIDGVVHLAGEGIAEKRWNDEQKARIRDSRTVGTAAIAEALAATDAKPRVFVSGSAIGYYGDRGQDELTETSTPGDDWLAQVCVDWENAAAPAARAGIRTALIRTGVVLSTDGGAMAKVLPLFKMGVGGVLSPGTQQFSWISIDDVVHGIIWLLDNEVEGPVNLTAPNPVSNKEYTKALGSALGRPTFLPTPSFGPKLVLGAELAQALLYTSARVLPTALIDSGYTFRHATIDEALTGLLGR
jgi:uncharacterized protein (TIGR01777 family)